jgi:50S ribosomal subunit-associated GTPase HflX
MHDNLCRFKTSILSKADTLKATEANRKRGPGTREEVRSKRINLEGYTHAQEINVSQLLL